MGAPKANGVTKWVRCLDGVHNLIVRIATNRTKDFPSGFYGDGAWRGLKPNGEWNLVRRSSKGEKTVVSGTYDNGKRVGVWVWREGRFKDIARVEHFSPEGELLLSVSYDSDGKVTSLHHDQLNVIYSPAADGRAVLELHYSNGDTLRRESLDGRLLSEVLRNGKREAMTPTSRGSETFDRIEKFEDGLIVGGFRYPQHVEGFINNLTKYIESLGGRTSRISLPEMLHMANGNFAEILSSQIWRESDFIIITGLELETPPQSNPQLPKQAWDFLELLNRHREKGIIAVGSPRSRLQEANHQIAFMEVKGYSTVPVLYQDFTQLRSNLRASILDIVAPLESRERHPDLVTPLGDMTRGDLNRALLYLEKLQAQRNSEKVIVNEIFREVSEDSRRERPTLFKINDPLLELLLIQRITL
jgi:hypothetical protein